MEGKIKWYSSYRGAGFIEGDDGQEICVLAQNIVDTDGDDELLEAERVSYDITFTSSGLMATNVRRIKSEPMTGAVKSYLVSGITAGMSVYNICRKMLKNIKENSLYNDIYNEKFMVQNETLEECTIRELRVLLFQGINLKDRVKKDDLDNVDMLLNEDYSASEFTRMMNLPEYSSGVIKVPTLFKILCLVHKEYARREDYKDKTTSVGLFLDFVDRFKWTFLEADSNNFGKYLNNSTLTHYFWISIKNMLETYAQRIIADEYLQRVKFDVNCDIIPTNDLSDKEKMLLEFILGADKVYCDSIEKSSRHVEKVRTDPTNPHPSVLIHYELPRIYADVTCAYGKDPSFLRLDDLLDGLLKKYKIEDDFVALQLFTFPMLYAYKNCETIMQRDSWIDEQYSRSRDNLIEAHNSSLIGYEDTEGLPFGVITNSILGATLYFAQDAYSRYSQIKTAQNKARREYEINERKLSNEYNALSWKTGIKKLDTYYDLLKKNILLASQLVAGYFGIDYGKVFGLYQSYIKAKQEEENRKFQEEMRRKQEQRKQILNEIALKKKELEELQNKYNAIGLALWGEKAKLKKSLQESINQQNLIIEKLQRKHDSI